MNKICKILPLVLVMCFLFGCQDNEIQAERDAVKAQKEIEEKNKAVVLKWFEKIGKGNIDEAFELFSPDYKLYFPSNTTTPLTKESNRDTAAMMFDVFPDIVHEVNDIFAVGDKVVFRAVDKATHTKEFQSIPATGKKFEVSWMVIFRLEDGKIVEGWEEVDWIGFMQQLGMELAPKKKE